MSNFLVNTAAVVRRRRVVARGASRAPRRAFFEAHPATTAARDDEKCTHDRMRRVYDELVPVANSISLSCASHVAPVHAPRCGFLLLLSSASLLPNHAISFHDQNLRIIHTHIPTSRRHRCVYIYIYISRPGNNPPETTNEEGRV